MKVVLTLAGFAAGAIIGMAVMFRLMNLRCNRQRETIGKNGSVISLLNEWIAMKNRQESVADRLLRLGYQRVAIYGMNFVGERLLEELEDSRITVIYGIDRRAAKLKAGIPLYTLDEKLEPIDVVIVTSEYHYEVISSDVERLTGFRTVCLMELLKQ